MPRLIDTDKLWKAITTRIEEYCDIADLIEIIETQPTVDAVPLEDYKSMEQTVNKLTKALADAEPVRHGKWTHTKGSNMRHDYTCSLCGCRITGVDPFSLSATAFYYCPECGAKMDEVEDD